MANAQQDKRKTDTRIRVVAEAERLYHQGGYEAISLQTVADKLKISKAALFYHFASKQELFFVVLNGILDRMNPALTTSVRDIRSGVRDQLRAVMRTMTQPPAFDITRFLRNELELLSTRQQRDIRQACDAKLFAHIRQVFQAGIAAGEMRQHDSNLSATLFLGMCTTLASFPVGGADASDAYAEQALDMFLHGLMKKQAK